MGREGFIKRIENSDEFKLLDKLVNQADASLEDAIQDVVNLSTIENPENPTDPHHGFSYVDYKVSLGLIELSQRLEPAKHRRLVEFVAELQTLTVIDPSTGEPFKTQGSTIWTDLPSLGYTELETWCEYGGDYKGPDEYQMEPEQEKRWLNFNAFIAQLSQAAKVDHNSPTSNEEVQDIHPMDKSLRAIWTMQMALENEKYPPAELANNSSMRAACLWFIHASERLWAHVLNDRRYDKSCGAGCRMYDWKGWTGFHRERWSVWEESLREARDACTDEDMKRMIGDALMHMERARANE